MKINQFKAYKVHNRFKFDIKFKNEINLITGKNGSGKTTALRFINALIEPDLGWLLETNFQHAEIHLTNKGKSIQVIAKKDNGVLTIEFVQDKETLAKDEYELGLEELQYRQSRAVGRGRRKSLLFEDKNITSLALIEDLPKPMYLSLLRKHAVEKKAVRRRLRGGEVLQDRKESDLTIALDMIKSEVSKMELKHNKLTVELREDILVGDFNTSQMIEPIEYKFDKKFREKIFQFRESIVPAFRAIGIPEAKIQDNVIPFFERSERDAKTIEDEEVEDMSKFGALPDKVRSALVRLFGDMEKFSSMSLYQNLIRKFNEDKELVFKERDKFLDILNSFYSDSGITAKIDSLGNLLLNEGNIKAKHLSSGERQILVLITHLIFNKEVRRSDLMIIDEPELSLHIAWQEIFCKKVTEANKSIQAVLATHSPSIISGRTKDCISL